MVDLKQVIVPGGGQSDSWQELEWRKKYAGEVRIELTYYDSRPKIDKPAPRRGSAREMQGDAEGPSGPRQLTPVKRRPLPSNRGSGSSTPSDYPRLQASGPRIHGTPPTHYSGDTSTARQRQDTVSSSHSQPIDRRRALSAMTGDYDEQQYNSFDQDRISYPSQFSKNSRLHSNFDDHNGHFGPYNGDQYSNDLDYQDELPILDHSIDHFNAVTQPYREQYDGMDTHHQLHHAYSAPVPSEFVQQSNIVLRRSMTEADAEFYPQTYGDSWDKNNNPFGPDHPESLKHLEPGNYNYEHDPETGYVPNGFGHDFEPEYGNGTVPEQNFEEGIPPPPPPTHRYGTMHRHPQSSTSHNKVDDIWDSHQAYDEPNEWQPPPKSIYGGRGHLASKSEVCLPSFREHFDEPRIKELEYHQQRRSCNSEFNPTPYGENFALPRRSSSPQNISHLDHYTSSQKYLHRSDLDPYSNETTHSPTDFDNDYVSRQDFRRDGYELGNSQGSKYKSSPQVYPLNSPSPRSSPHSMNGSTSQHGQQTPTRPHPLSKNETLSNSPDYQTSSPYEGIPLIKPLAISPSKLKLNQSTSSDRYSNHQAQSSITRKSISPRPLLDQKTSFSSPYSPDSFDVLNPAVSSQEGTTESPLAQSARRSYNAKKDDPIVDFHGNVVDPSDRLPETSWAPEPIRKNSKDPSYTQSSGWTREPSLTQTTPRKIRLRIGAPDKLAGSRDINQQQSYGSGSSPANRASMYASSPLNSSPAEPSPSTRNRLVKKSRPQSMAVTSSWSQPIRDVPTPPAMNGGSKNYSEAGPLVPAKIPLDSPRSSANYGVSFTNNVANDQSREGPFSLSTGIQSMNIGNGINSIPRRVGGRRLLGFGG